ncbi:murein DD-endopeptidase MepM [Aliivibrio fischeri]|uniref:murein DD-endopeptidase MepM n=1 Tax=Aliivibrio fischeri TaxID=668 RepID=UPI0012DA5EDA|nr:murein DD-endopeptidase MepM [Aliivibrio fischeri]MUK93288.1 murein DD-endopeptidase MepM [Aliivibrio fischeri]
MKYKEVLAARINSLSKRHKLVLMSLSLFTVVVFIWEPTHSISQSLSEPSRSTVTLSSENLQTLADQNSEPVETIFDPNDPEFNAPKDELDKHINAEDIVHSHTVDAGETLGAIFNQYALSISDMYALLDVNKSAANMRVGVDLEWQQDEDGKLTELKIHRNIKDTDVYAWNGEKYTFTQIEEKGEIKPVFLSGRVTSNFYNSARSAGLTPGQIQTLAKQLQWKFDFGKEARKGDRFAVEIDKEFIDGKAVSSGDVKAVLYKNAGRDITLIKHTDGHYYDVQGRSLNRALERYPTHQRFRISSPFNPYRKHPVTGRISPHNGTDFAAPVGTSVYATGDGVVVRALHHPLAGNYIIIKHGREYMTRYLHLSKILVKKGQKVSMGDKIALSGNTGRSTGPHLHYELIKNGRAVNAMKVPLPQASPVKSDERARFKQQAKLTIEALQEQV